MKTWLFFTLLAAAPSLYGQAACQAFAFNPLTGRQDCVVAAPGSLKNGSSLPGTCNPGNVFVLTDGTPTGTLYVCSATNTWSAVTSTGSTLVTSFNGRIGAILASSSDVGLSNVVNVDQTDGTNITHGVVSQSVIDLAIARRNYSNSFGNITMVTLATPSAPTIANVGTTGATTYTYKVVALNQDGSSTVASATASTATGNATLTSLNYNTVTTAAVTNAYTCRVYRTVGGGSTGRIGFPVTCGSVFNDIGLAGDSTSSPATNTTGLLGLANELVANIPTTCLVGQVYFAGNATAGQNLYFCTATNTWTQMTGGGGGSPGGSPGQFQYNNTTFAGATFLLAGSTAAANAGNSSIVSTLAPNGVSHVLIEPSCSPAGGNLQAGTCSFINEGGLFNPASGGNLAGQAIQYQMFNGRNIYDGTTFDKKTLNGLYLNGFFQGSGQKFGINNSVDCAGAGDCFAESSLVYTGAPARTAGDEGPSGYSAVVSQPLHLLTADLSGNPTVSSCAISALPNGVPTKSTSPTDTKTANVTGSTAACNIGDWLVIDNETTFSATEMSIEAIQIVSKTSSTITALFQNTHANGTPVAPAPVISFGAFYNTGDWGQQRIYVNLSGATYSTGSIASISGVTVTGSGTSWTGLIAALGTDTKLPGCIKFTKDTTSSWPGGVPLVSYYPIKSVDSATQLTLAVGYTLPSFPSGSTAYAAYSCDESLALAMSYGASSDAVTGIVMRHNAATWTTTQTIEQSVSPYQEYSKIYQAIWAAYTAVKTPPDMYRAFNTGNSAAQTGFHIVASYLDDATHPSYIDGISIEANTRESAITIGGVNMNGIGINLSTTTAGAGDPKAIRWGGSKFASIYPNLSTGSLTLDSSAAKKVTFLSNISSGSGFGTTFDYSGLTASRTLTIPDANGTIALAFPGSFTRVIPAAANDEVDIGTFQAAPDHTFSISINANNTTKLYSFTTSFDITANTWEIVSPLSSTAYATTDFALDANQNSGVTSLRIRRVDSGGGTPTANVTILSYGDPATTFTPSILSSTVTPPTLYWPSAGISQVSNRVVLTNRLQLNSVAFASLGTCNAGAAGVIVYCPDCKNVTDNTTGTFDSVAAGSGNGTNVLCENSAWRVH